MDLFARHPPACCCWALLRRSRNVRMRFHCVSVRTPRHVDEHHQLAIEELRVAADDLIDLRVGMEKTNIALRFELDRPAARPRQDPQHRAPADARGKLFDRELMMLVDMRAS